MSINRMQIWDCMSSHAISIVGEVSSYFITCSGGVHSVIICYNICLSVLSSTQACNTLTARNSTVVYMLTGGLYIAVIPWTALLCSCREKHEHNHQPMLHQVLYMHARHQISLTTTQSYVLSASDVIPAMSLGDRWKGWDRGIWAGGCWVGQGELVGVGVMAYCTDSWVSACL